MLTLVSLVWVNDFQDLSTKKRKEKKMHLTVLEKIPTTVKPKLSSMKSCLSD